MNKYLIALVMVVLAGAGYSQRSEAAACPLAATAYACAWFGARGAARACTAQHTSRAGSDGTRAAGVGEALRAIGKSTLARGGNAAAGSA